MSIGLYVWIGIDPSKPEGDDAHTDARTVAPDENLCLERIAALGAAGVDLEPSRRVLILKGRMGR